MIHKNVGTFDIIIGLWSALYKKFHVLLTCLIIWWKIYWTDWIVLIMIWFGFFSLPLSFCDVKLRLLLINQTKRKRKTNSRFTRFGHLIGRLLDKAVCQEILPLFSRLSLWLTEFIRLFPLLSCSYIYIYIYCSVSITVHFLILNWNNSLVAAYADFTFEKTKLQSMITLSIANCICFLLMNAPTYNAESGEKIFCWKSQNESFEKKHPMLKKAPECMQQWLKLCLL